MKEVTLTNGGAALVDDDDLSLVSQYHWWASHKRNGVYAETTVGHYTFGMHRLILGLTKGDPRQGDHRDGNGLDNRRANLRIATRSDNQRNQQRHVPKHGYRGICPCVHRWRAQLSVNGQIIYLGHYVTKEAAAHAYDKAASLHFGEFAVLNFPDRVTVAAS